MYAFKRILKVVLKNANGKTIEFGATENGSDELNIKIKCNKYMSALKDSCTVRISNLTYPEIVQIINGKYYDVEIIAGYKSSGYQTIFKGGVIYISNSIDDTKSNTVIILCSSNLVAKYGQTKLNLTFKSGVNLYSAIKYASKLAGLKDTEININSKLKAKMIQEAITVDTNLGTWLDRLGKTDQSLIINSDSSLGSSFSIFDSENSNNRVIKIRDDNIILETYPQLTQDGLTLTLMPTMSLMCGDVIVIDNSIINIPVFNKSEISSNYGYYLDDDGKYMIYEIQYSLSNRSNDFSMNLLCKSRSLISNFIGVS